VTGALCSPPRIIVVPTVVSFCELRHARWGEAVVGALHGPRERANPKSCAGSDGRALAARRRRRGRAHTKRSGDLAGSTGTRAASARPRLTGPARAP